MPHLHTIHQLLYNKGACHMYIIGYPLLAILGIIEAGITLYSFVVLAAVILSFVNPDPRNPIVRTIAAVTEPVFARVRRFLPPVGMLDLSPLVVLLALQFAQQGILPIFERAALQLTM